MACCFPLSLAVQTNSNTGFMQRTYQFMVVFRLPEELSDEFLDLLPEQRARVTELFEEGVLLSYALSLEHSRLWAVFQATSEMAVLEYIATLPLSSYMQVRVSILTFYNTHSEAVPNFSLN